MKGFAQIATGVRAGELVMTTAGPRTDYTTWSTAALWARRREIGAETRLAPNIVPIPVYAELIAELRRRRHE